MQILSSIFRCGCANYRRTHHATRTAPDGTVPHYRQPSIPPGAVRVGLATFVSVPSSGVLQRRPAIWKV